MEKVRRGERDKVFVEFCALHFTGNKVREVAEMLKVGTTTRLEFFLNLKTKTTITAYRLLAKESKMFLPMCKYFLEMTDVMDQTA